MKYYVLERDGERTIVCVAEGQDPLYGMGSWNLLSGPYSGFVEACDAAAVKETK
jgi:hypothetical protein